jgi:hypothetical protein
MATIKFVGVPGEAMDAIHQYGVDFSKGRAVDVGAGNGLMKREHIEKLKMHPHFAVEDDVTDVQVKSETQTKPSRAELEQLAEAVGLKVDGRWSDERLITETEKAAAEKK